MTKRKKDYSQKNSVYFKKLPQIVAALKKGYKPEKIILFGSMLDDKVKSHDIDLFLVKNGVEKFDRRERYDQVSRLLSHDVPMDILVYTPYEVKKRLYLGDPFVKTIVNGGKLLYGS